MLLMEDIWEDDKGEFLEPGQVPSGGQIRALDSCNVVSMIRPDLVIGGA